MEGYSVTEAASVLGVPTERVWELLARGVLSGVPDGETGMRVFLQPRPAPTAVEEPRRTNGGGSTHEREPEASPFRELLSEFRNLTERYGQALLALGEARGEVASLRSRVDLLEARFDLRLPMSGPMAAPASSPAGWGQPTVRPMPETHAPADAASPADAAEEEVEVESSPRRRRRRGQHRATDDFAEALARAEDPSPAELPGGAEAAAAFAALRDQTAAETPDAGEAAYPRELPAAEPMGFETEPEPTLEPVVETAFTSPVEGEPDEAASIIEPVMVEPPLPETQPEATTEMEAGPPEPAAEVGAAPEPVAVAQPRSDADEAEAVSAFQPDDPAAVASAPEAESALGFDLDPPVAGELEPQPEVDAADPFAQPPESQVEVAEAEAEAEADVEIEADGADASMHPVEDEVVTAEAAPEAPSDRDASWDRDRYTARIEEPDWIPEERSVPEPAMAAEPEPLADQQSEPEPDTEQQAEPEQVPQPQREREPEFVSVPQPEQEPERAEPVSWDADTTPQPGSEDVAPDEATPSGEETMLWFGREPNRAASAWPAEDDFAAEMEVSTGSSAGAPWVGDEPVTFEAEDDVPSARALGAPEQRFVTPPHLVRAQPLTSPASRAYRRLRRIFPG